MSIDFRNFPAIARDVVSSVRETYDTEKNNVPVFEVGTYLELTRRMSVRQTISDDKYPLIWLVWEANENVKKWTDTSSYKLSPRFFICTGANMSESGSTRYESNFTGILQPILALFKEEISYHVNISTTSYINNNEAEHLLWGESLGYSKKENVLFDTLDAIEIKFNELLITKTC